MAKNRIWTVFLCLIIVSVCISVSGCVSQTTDDPQRTMNTYAGTWSLALDTTSYYLTVNLDDLSNRYSWIITVKNADNFNKLYNGTLDYLCNNGDSISTSGQIIPVGDNTYRMVADTTTVYDKTGTTLSKYIITSDNQNLDTTRFTYDNVSDTITVTDAYSTLKFKRLY